MTKGATQLKWDKFVRNMIDYGSQSVADLIRAYRDAYPTCKKDSTARVGGYALLQKPEIVQAIENGLHEKEAMYQKARQRAIEKAAKEQVITELEVDATISQLILGNVKRKRKIAAFDKETKKFHIAEVEEGPDHAALVSAANLFYKRRGSFPPVGVKHEVGDSFIEALKALSQKKKEK